MTDLPSGFVLEGAISFDSEESENTSIRRPTSELSNSEALTSAQLIELVDSEGSIIFYPKHVDLQVGDVLFLRERQANEDGQPADDGSDDNKQQDVEASPDALIETSDDAGIPDQELEISENGVIVQVISMGTARYPQADTKALFRLMTNVRTAVLDRSFNEPSEVIDEFLLAEFKVRASIIDGEWTASDGRSVSRNVDIFWLDPEVLIGHILRPVDGLNVNLGDYKEEEVTFAGTGFEKINLITGMKGAGKSHIAKGIISESLNAGMSAVVFDINNEYGNLPGSAPFIPLQNLRFRLDRIPTSTFLKLISRIAPFAERTEQLANARLPAIIRSRPRPDIDFLIQQQNNVIEAGGEMGVNMRRSYEAVLRVIQSYGLFMTAEEANAEDEYMRAVTNNEGADLEPLEVVSLRSVLFNIEHNNAPGVIVFDIGGLSRIIQYSVVDLIIETLKDISARQTVAYNEQTITVPQYPTIFFEEAHMYMESGVIDELLPLIRHYGMNVFFVTNTPVALPDSVFRLIDNLIMTRIVNARDINQVKNCGLTDAETIEGFARNLREHHALFLSGLQGATSNFPLVFHVRDFGLPPSGETRSTWRALEAQAIQTQLPDGSEAEQQTE